MMSAPWLAITVLGLTDDDDANQDDADDDDDDDDANILHDW